MQTEMKTKCDGNCCNPDKVTQPSALSYNQSPCECWRQKVECGPECGCDPSICNNRQMSLNQSLVLGGDVEERTAWGIDLCTAFNLL